MSYPFLITPQFNDCEAEAAAADGAQPPATKERALLSSSELIALRINKPIQIQFKTKRSGYGISLSKFDQCENNLYPLSSVLCMVVLEQFFGKEQMFSVVSKKAQRTQLRMR